MEEDLKVYRDEIENIQKEFQRTLANRQNQIAKLSQRRNEIENGLLEQGYSYTDLYMNEDIAKINSQMEQLNQLSQQEGAEVLKNVEKINLKLEKLTDISKKIEARETELENQGIGYGEIALDEEIIKLKAEFSKIAGDKELLRKAQQERAAKEKYKELQDRKAKLSENISNISKNKLFDEREGRIAALNELASKGKRIDDPEYKEYMNDIQKINKELEKIDKEIADSKQEIKDIDEEIEKLEKQYGKEFFVGKAKNEKIEVKTDKKVEESEPEQVPVQKTEPVQKTTEKSEEEQEPVQKSESEKKKDEDENKDVEEVTVTEPTGKEKIVAEVEPKVIEEKNKNLGNKQTTPQQGTKKQESPKQGNTGKTTGSKDGKETTNKDVDDILNGNKSKEEDLTNDIRHQILINGINLNGIGIDVSRATATLSFDNGIIKEIDFSGMLDNLSSRKFTKELNKKGIRLYGKMDPYMTYSIDKAISEIFKENNIKNSITQSRITNKILKDYEKSINDFEEEKNSYRPIHITYMKMFAENMEEKHKKFEKSLRPYVRYAENSENVTVSENIDTRNWFERLTDKVRSVFNPKSTLPGFVKENMNEKSEGNRVPALPEHKEKEPNKEEAFGENLRKNVPSLEEQAKKAMAIKEEMNVSARDIASKNIAANLDTANKEDR